MGHIVSVSWGDHLLFGEGDGRLATLDAVARRLDRWRDELRATTLHWRLHRTRIPGRFHAARGRRHPSQASGTEVDWDDLKSVPHRAKTAGLTPYLYVTLFDEGWSLAHKRAREISFHNAMHGQHVSWQSEFSRSHPEYLVVDRTGRERQWGVCCLGYPEVRAHFQDRFIRLLEGSGFDGLFVCLRSQSKPAPHGDHYGFNDPVRDDYLARHGKDIRTEPFEIAAWRDLLGEYLTMFLRELRAVLRAGKYRLAVGTPRGDVLGPPLGNTTLDWRRWVREGLVDELIVNQNSSRCPSMWHRLWPMHHSDGYACDYRTGAGMPPLVDHLAGDYNRLFSESEARLYVARQWDERSQIEEDRLCALPGVSGLVFSSFRFDNPGPIARGDWRA